MHRKLIGIALATSMAALVFVTGASTAPAQTTSLTVYSGRDAALVKPIMDRFTRETGITLNVRYASSASLATALVEEGGNSPADVYWSQEPGTLGLVGARGLLARLPQKTVGEGPVEVLDAQPPLGRDERALAGARLQHAGSPAPAASRLGLGAHECTLEGEDRCRTHERVLPGVSRRRRSYLLGEARVRTWLRGLQSNDVRFYPNNTSVVQAVGRGDIEAGLVNHYYLYNVLAGHAGPADRQPLVPSGRPGQPRARRRRRRRRVDEEERRRLSGSSTSSISKWAQRFIARGPGAAEYPVIKGVPRRPGLPALTEIRGPKYSLGRLSADLAPAVRLLLELGYIK